MRTEKKFSFVIHKSEVFSSLYNINIENCNETGHRLNYISRNRENSSLICKMLGILFITFELNLMKPEAIADKCSLSNYKTRYVISKRDFLARLSISRLR